MRAYSRHAFGLVLMLLLTAGLSGCFRSAGGSLEPTPVAFDGAGAAQETPLPLPSLTATGTGEDFEPTPEIATEPPSPIPPSPTAPDAAALPGQGGEAVGFLPTNTFIPLPTATPLPTETPTVGPTATFTSVPFVPLPPTPTYTLFMPPVGGQVGAEALPLGELGPGTPPAEAIAPEAEGQGGFEEAPAGVEIAQVGTLTIPQMTSTAMIASFNLTQAALQGTIYPTETPAFIQPQDGGLGLQQALPTPTVPVAAAGICSEHLIAPGENLYRLSIRYGVTVDAIAQANNIVNPSLILAGDTLQIPCPSPATTTTGQGGATTTTTTSPGRYIVEPGDNLYRISIKFGVSMSALMTANGMTPATINFLRAGQELIIP